MKGGGKKDWGIFTPCNKPFIMNINNPFHVYNTLTFKYRLLSAEWGIVCRT